MPCALSDCGACGGIAHVVHQSWMTAQLPGELEPLSARWRRAGPSGWDHRLWTDDANRALWAAHFPELLPVYDGYPTAVQRADVTRLLYMHVHGGVYADLDVAPCDSAWAALEQQKQVCLPHPNSTPRLAAGDAEQVTSLLTRARLALDSCCWCAGRTAGTGAARSRRSPTA